MSNHTSTFSSCIPSLNLHYKYSKLVQINLNPLASKVCLHNSNLAFTPLCVLSISTMSFTNNIRQRTSSLMYHINSSITNTKKNEIKVNTLCNPIFTGKYSLYPYVIHNFFPPYMSFISLNQTTSTSLVPKHLQWTFLGT